MLPIPLNYLTILKWVGLAAAVVALVGIPVWYVNHKIDAAFEKGKSVGMAECQMAVAEALAEEATRAGKIILEEQLKAQELGEKNAKLQTKVTKLQGEVAKALGATPLPVGCVANSAATSLLRSASEGDFGADGAALPDNIDPKVPPPTSVPGEGGIKSS